MVAVQLPGGFWHAGVCHRDAELRPLTGADEAALADEAESLVPASFAIAVLGRCLSRLGPLAPVDGAAIRDLLIGDCEALLLQVHRLSYGDRLVCQASCPSDDCGTRIECELATEELLLPPAEAPMQWHEARVDGRGMPPLLRFRLPTVGDRERAVAAARRNLGAACDELVQGLLAPGQKTDPGGIRPFLNARVAELDPQAELRLALTCPDCARPVSILLDAGRFLFDTIRQRARQVFHDVHRLSRCYHWSERDILAMSDGRRRRYLDLLAGEAAS